MVWSLTSRTGQALTDLSKLPSDFCKATGLHPSQDNSAPYNNTVQPKQEVTIYANGTTHIDPLKVADNIT